MSDGHHQPGDAQPASQPAETAGPASDADPATTGRPATGGPTGLADDLASELAAAAASLADGDLVAAAADLAAAEVTEDLVLASVARQRDEYLDALRHLQADFENYKKRMNKLQLQMGERAAELLVTKLLPVCDTADLAIAHGGGEEVKQVWTALFDALEAEGLERIDPVGVPFDPTVHEAVAHEPADGAGDPEVVEVMRAGYRWKGRVLRPAMVKVRG